MIPKVHPWYTLETNHGKKNYKTCIPQVDSVWKLIISRFPCSMMTLAHFHIFHADHGAFLRCCHTLQVSLQRVIIATLVTNRSSLLHSFRCMSWCILSIQYSIYVSTPSMNLVTKKTRCSGIRRLRLLLKM